MNTIKPSLGAIATIKQVQAVANEASVRDAYKINVQPYTGELQINATTPISVAKLQIAPAVMPPANVARVVAPMVNAPAVMPKEKPIVLDPDGGKYFLQPALQPAENPIPVLTELLKAELPSPPTRTAVEPQKQSDVITPIITPPAPVTKDEPKESKGIHWAWWAVPLLAFGGYLMLPQSGEKAKKISLNGAKNSNKNQPKKSTKKKAVKKLTI